MTKTVFKLALPGYRADTDTNPNHFSVYADTDDPNDYVLIKEKERNSLMLAANTHTDITHNLGYVPMVFVYAETKGDEWRLVGGDSSDLNAFIELNTSVLRIWNTSNKATKFKYYMFYDQVI